MQLLSLYLVGSGCRVPRPCIPTSAISICTSTRRGISCPSHSPNRPHVDWSCSESTHGRGPPRKIHCADSRKRWIPTTTAWRSGNHHHHPSHSFQPVSCPNNHSLSARS